jgi:hypothetical protein
MATSLKTTTRNRAPDGITTDVGATGFLWIWTGSAPAKSSNNFVVPTGTNLALFTLANPLGAGSSIGVLTVTPPANCTALASGTPGYYRMTAGLSLVLSQAGIVSTTVTYTGTITGGGSNAFVGGLVNISGFTNAGNNGTFAITASTATTLVVTNASGVNETHAGTAVLDNATQVVLQGSAAVGSGDINFSSTIASGGSVSLTSLTYTEGNA